MIGVNRPRSTIATPTDTRAASASYGAMNINELAASTSPPTGPAGQAVQRKEGKKRKRVCGLSEQPDMLCSLLGDSSCGDDACDGD
jgi:hypothetical protein